jgi:hypothetical protein
MEKVYYGKLNYNLYKNAVGGKTWNGENMKQFDEMPINIQNAWIEGASGVILELLNPHSHVNLLYISTQNQKSCIEE